MGVPFGLDDREKEVLKGLITYFATRVAHLQEVKLGKLIYMVQLYHYTNHRELFTKIPFLSLSRGPHAPAIRSVIKEQLENREIYVKVARSTKDPFNPCLILRSHKVGGKGLSAKWFDTAEEVLDDWGDKRFEEILDYTTRTIPFLATSYRDTIDMTELELVCDLNSVLSLPERDRIHRFVKAPEEEHFQEPCRRGSKTVTVKEVAEIYLSLCGDLPEKIPYRNHLGFSVCKILQALEGLFKKDNTVTSDQRTDIDRAAQLTGELIYSSCFRKVNYKVALKTGMLFLNRNGYSFKRNELKKNITGMDDYQTLQKWFARVSTKPELNRM